MYRLFHPIFSDSDDTGKTGRPKDVKQLCITDMFKPKPKVKNQKKNT
jgi:hypothetical protein